MDDATPQQTAPQSNRDEELDKAFLAALVEQPKQLDKLAKVLLALSFVVPVLYAIGLKFFIGEASSSGIWLMVLAFLSWFVSVLLSLFCLIPRKRKAQGAEAMYLAAIRYKTRMLIGSSLTCFFGVCMAAFTFVGKPSSPVQGKLQAKQAPVNFVLIRGGEFAMGSLDNEVGRQPDETQHQVKVSDFYMGKYEVTFAEFKKFIEESGYPTDAEKGKDTWNWHHGPSGKERTQMEENHPVVNVSWNDADAYCKWLSQKTGQMYRLPTEAEWEYACRAGTPTPFNTGDNVTTDQANYDGNSPYNNNQKGVYRENTLPVDTFKPNNWGLYNMHGNVWEWCTDWYDGGASYYEGCKAGGVAVNPEGPKKGSNRLIRGGSWNYFAGGCRSAARGNLPPDYRNSSVGFRLAFTP